MKPKNTRVVGPLSQYVATLWEYLLSRGYSPLTCGNIACVMAHFSRWLQRTKTSPNALSEEDLDNFIRHRRRTYVLYRSRRALNPILECLTKAKVVKLSTRRRVSAGTFDKLLTQYDKYLSKERNVSKGVRKYYLKVASEFLGGTVKGRHKLGSLAGADLTRFVLKNFAKLSVGSCKQLVTALRSLLRFLFMSGKIRRDLSVAVPAVAGWRLTSLPKSLRSDEVERLLTRCDRRNAKGRLWYAALLLMVRLGLRACEAGTLTLDDVHWRDGEIVVRGKGGREEMLPLPRDVGDALAEYIKCSRPRIHLRHVFISTKAPHKALGSGGVRRIVAAACQKADISPPGAHRLRHTAATEMLRKGVPIPKIAQVLRHKDIRTTAIYAKVDYEALRTVAEPWMGGAA